MEIHCADYHKNGIIRQRTPKLAGTSSPGGTYATKDEKWVVLVCSTDRTWEYLTVAMKRPDLLTNPLFATMKVRVANDALLDGIVREWIAGCDFAALKEIVDREGVPVNLVYSVEDCFNDPHYQARQNVVEMPHPTLGSIKMPGITPIFSETPGEIKWVGPELGAHNLEVYQEILGLNSADIDALRIEGVI